MSDRKRKLDIFSDTAPPVSVQPTTNPHTGRPYSNRYYDILAKRKGEGPLRPEMVLCKRSFTSASAPQNLPSTVLLLSVS